MSMLGDNNYRNSSELRVGAVELKGLTTEENEEFNVSKNLDPRKFRIGFDRIDTLKREVIIRLISYEEVKAVDDYFKREDFNVYYAKVNNEDSLAHLLKYFVRDKELLIFLSHSTTHGGLGNPDKFNPDSVMIINDNMDYHQKNIDLKKCYTFKDAVFGEKFESISDKTLRVIKKVAKDDGIRYIELVHANSGSINPVTFKEINQAFVDAVK